MSRARAGGAVPACAVADCERSDRMVRGWCSMHYQRWAKWGDPEYLHNRGGVVHGTSDGYSNHGCRCTECREAHRIAQGMYQHARSLRLGRCSVRDCDGYQYAKGLCRAHYERMRRTGDVGSRQVPRRPRAQIFLAVATPAAGPVILATTPAERR